MDALQAIEARKSKRNYLNIPVEIEKVEILTRAGNGAPKAGNFHISVITNAGMLNEIDKKALESMKQSDFLKLRANFLDTIPCMVRRFYSLFPHRIFSLRRQIPLVPQPTLPLLLPH
jgi:nitroreductase